MLQTTAVAQIPVRVGKGVIVPNKEHRVEIAVKPGQFASIQNYGLLRHKAELVPVVNWDSMFLVSPGFKIPTVHKK